MSSIPKTIANLVIDITNQISEARISQGNQERIYMKKQLAWMFKII